MKFVASSSGPLKPPSYYRAKVAALTKLLGRLAAEGTEAAERKARLVVRPRLQWAEDRLRAAERNEVRKEGAAACRVGKPLAACPVHPLLPPGERLFCPWCDGWWDERVPAARKKGRGR